MTLPFAVLGALVAALIETTVLPELAIAGTHADLVLSFAIVATIVIGTEDGLAWAFVGGLMLDMLIPARPIGATTLSLLLVVGIAAAGAHFVGHNRRLFALVSTFGLTWVFHAVLLVVLVLVEGVAFSAFQPRLVLLSAAWNTLVALAAAIAFSAAMRRFGAAERLDW